MADLDSRAVGNMRQNAQNEEQLKVIRNSNNFPLDFSHPTTHRYADVDLFYHYYGERGDTLPLRTGHSVRTFTMSSPNEIDIYMRKHFCHIPMKAIYPRTWDDVLYPLPVDGDVAPVDGRANFNVAKYVYCLVKSLQFYQDNITSDNFGKVMHILDALSNVVSNGSLFAKLNIHLSSLVKCSFGEYKSISLDRFVSLFYDDLNSNLRGNSFQFSLDGSSRIIYFGDDTDNVIANASIVSSFHQFHDFVRAYDYNVVSLASIDDDPVIYDFSSWGVSFFTYGLTVADPFVEYINIEPILAYQLCCAQFYTNDRVDNIYSANTYRNYIQFLQSEAGLSLDSFIFNDVEFLYDIFSQHKFDQLLNNLFTSVNDNNLNFHYVTAIDQMFTYRRSLRFGDYFNGARTRPLAVGESSVPVADGAVQIEDITRSAALQKLRYNINVIGRKINNQLMGLIPGLAPDTPDDIPTSIASQDFNIGKNQTEVANTGAAQVSDSPDDSFPVTVHLNSGASDFVFKINITEPCIILGLVSFSVPRVYSKTIDRFAFHKDRFDMFIPQMQFIGDQEIYRKELFGLNVPDKDDAFAYNQRYSEYKQRYSYASGGFVEFLKSWDMITDNTDGILTTGFRVLDVNIAHSIPSEFDRFYKSLNGKSLADYFHFIVKHYCTSAPSRAMAWNPTPLL